MQSISFRDLFDHIGSPRMTFSKRAEALSGEEVELRGYLVAMHSDERQITLAGEAGVCPDCADKPVAYRAPPGFQSRGEPVQPAGGALERQVVLRFRGGAGRLRHVSAAGECERRDRAQARFAVG